MNSIIRGVLIFIQTRGTSLIVCASALVFGLMAINNILKMVKRAFINSKMDNSIIKLSLTFAKVVLYFVVLLYIVSSLGIKLTGFIAVFSAFSLATGLAIQDVISGVANGMVIVSSKPFKVGDHVQIGSVEGIIREIRIMHTVIDTFDKVQIFLPNKVVYNAEILNFSADPVRRLDFNISVDYDTDMKKAAEVIEDVAKSFKYSLSKPAPFVYMAAMENSSVVFNVRFWVKNEEYWTAKFAFNSVVFDALKKAGISIPFPQVMLSQRKEMYNQLAGFKENESDDKQNSTGRRAKK